MFQRTLQKALEKNSQREDEMKILTCRIQEKDQSLNALKSECCCTTMQENVFSAVNDLDVFAKNEGGLIGMAREIEAIQKVVQVSTNKLSNLLKGISNRDLRL
jgi:hypothetical protein